MEYQLYFRDAGNAPYLIGVIRNEKSIFDGILEPGIPHQEVSWEIKGCPDRNVCQIIIDKKQWDN